MYPINFGGDTKSSMEIKPTSTNYQHHLTILRDDLKRRLAEVERAIEILESEPKMLELLNLTRNIGI